MRVEYTQTRSEYIFTSSREEIREVLQEGEHVDYWTQVLENGLPYVGKIANVRESLYTLGCQRCQAVLLRSGDQYVLLHVAPAVCGTWYLQFKEYLRNLCKGLHVTEGTVLGFPGRVQQKVAEIVSDTLDISPKVVFIETSAIMADVYVYKGEMVVVHCHCDGRAIRKLKIVEQTRMLMR